LDIELFVLEKSSGAIEGEFANRHTLQGRKVIPFGTHHKLKQYSGLPDINDILKREFKKQKGSMLISGKLGKSIINGTFLELKEGSVCSPGDGGRNTHLYPAQDDQKRSSH
jgi:hypothetical protein